MPEQENLSTALDEARAMEEHYRALLLFWKERRQRLESQIPLDNPWQELLEEIASDDNGHTNFIPA